MEPALFLMEMDECEECQKVNIMKDIIIDKQVINYDKLTEGNIGEVVRKYVHYYNHQEEGCWTYEKAYKRIHQVMIIEDAECMVQYENDNMTGFVMGFYKEFDDLKAYFLEEIVIFSKYQNYGYGTLLLQELECCVRQNGVEHIELISVNDAHHMHFYEKQGFYVAKNLVMMGKHYDS